MKHFFQYYFVAIASLFCDAALSQDIQPLGISIGTYSIMANSTGRVQTFCMDHSLFTTPGNIYDRVALGNESDILIGNESYKVQDAIEQKLISIVLDKDGADHQMYLAIKNNTSKEITWKVNKDVVLSNAKSSNTLKDIYPLNATLEGLNVTRQEYIWFHHGYDEYLKKYKDFLIENQIINSNETLSLNEYLTRRENFLDKNGVKDKKLIDESQLFEVFDWSLIKLLYTKRIIKQYSDVDGSRMYHIRFANKGNENYYVLDDGSPLCYFSQSNTDIIDKIGKSENRTIVAFDSDFPIDKKPGFLDGLKNEKVDWVEIPNNNIFKAADFFIKNPDIKSVGRIISETKQSFSFVTEYSTFRQIKKEMKVISTNKPFLNKLATWFRALIGKKTNQSLAEIYLEGKEIARRAFPGQKIKSQVVLNYEKIITSSTDFKKMPIKNNLPKYANIRRYHQTQGLLGRNLYTLKLKEQKKEHQDIKRSRLFKICSLAFV